MSSNFSIYTTKEYCFASADLYSNLTDYSEKSATNPNDQKNEELLFKGDCLLGKILEPIDTLKKAVEENETLSFLEPFCKQLEEICDKLEEVHQKTRENIKPFDIMEGKKASDFSDYMIQYDKLATGQIFLSDKDYDSQINYEEYLKQTEGQAEEVRNEEQFSKYDFDGDGQIEHDELMTLYRLADILDGGNEDGKFINYDIENALEILNDVKTGKDTGEFKDAVEEIYKTAKELDS